MQLAIDIGNTFAKIGRFDDENEMVDFQKIEINKLTQFIENEVSIPTILSSTSNDTSDWAKILTDRGIYCLEQTAQTPVPILKNYETPQTLGTDRVAAAVGATVLFPNQNCLIIDLGTCAKYDFISSFGVFEGGIIAPGLQMRLDAMHYFTKRLPQIEAHKHDFPTLIGKSTTSAMLSGAINGMLAEINGLIERYINEHKQCKVLLCGGDAHLFETHIKIPTFAAPNLVLMGLNRILFYNASYQ